jgi:hypothetical protein
MTNIQLLLQGAGAKKWYYHYYTILKDVADMLPLAWFARFDKSCYRVRSSDSVKVGSRVGSPDSAVFRFRVGSPDSNTVATFVF